MTVYVDESRHPFGRMIMCHMIADTPAELHVMADRIGINRRWYQQDGSFPHYDICKSKRAEAVAAGARAVDSRELCRIIQQLRHSEAWS